MHVSLRAAACVAALTVFFAMGRPSFAQTPAPSPKSGSSSERVDRIVAIVSDDIITQSDVTKYAERLRKGGLTDDLIFPDDATKQAALKDREKLLTKMIEEKLLDAEVRRQGLSVPFERVDQELRAIATRNGISRDELKAAIVDKGVSFSQYQDFIKTGLERQSLISKQVTSKIKVSEDEVASQYSTSGGAKSGQLYEYTLAHVLFHTDKNAAASRKRADIAIAKLKEGMQFDKVAADFSDDPNFSAGGLLGTFRSGEMSKELDEAVQKLAVGEHTGLVPTKAGLHIVKVLRKVPVADPTAESDKDRIRASLYDKALKRQFQTWLDQLRKDAFVRINDRQYGANDK